MVIGGVYVEEIRRQNQIISLIQQGHTINASELAQHLNVSVRTISRDIVDLENQGVQIYAHKGKMVDIRFKNLKIK